MACRGITMSVMDLLVGIVAKHEDSPLTKVTLITLYQIGDLYMIQLLVTNQINQIKMSERGKMKSTLTKLEN